MCLMDVNSFLFTLFIDIDYGESLFDTPTQLSTVLGVLFIFESLNMVLDLIELIIICFPLCHKDIRKENETEGEHSQNRIRNIYNVQPEQSTNGYASETNEQQPSTFQNGRVQNRVYATNNLYSGHSHVPQPGLFMPNSYSYEQPGLSMPNQYGYIQPRPTILQPSTDRYTHPSISP
ncbi:unnamed protein product [Mytilus coruscus]|uniref:Uncharacterized protein n=1 Tax=Mytilus coruscus TaxID=42192 RepID=A0A6J8ESK3_MYTCO|nr:unnamed protein product [Mytilus coruscus]